MFMEFGFGFDLDGRDNDIYFTLIDTSASMQVTPCDSE